MSKHAAPSEPFAQRGAFFNQDRTFRYWLFRQWDETLPKAMCIGLNPSTANEIDNDPTIKRLMPLLKNAGYGGFYMCNLFAFVSPNPDDLRRIIDATGDNDYHLHYCYQQTDAVIFCWGNFKVAQYKAKKMIKYFPNALCFGKNANGSPKHPLYMKSTTKLETYA